MLTNTKIKNMNKIVLIGAVALVILISGIIFFTRSEDQAALNQKITPDGEMKGSEIRGPVAREAAERWPRIASAANIIV